MVELQPRFATTKALRELDLGILPAGGATVTVGRFLADWLALIETSLRVPSYERYEGIVRVQIKPNIGKV